VLYFNQRKQKKRKEKNMIWISSGLLFLVVCGFYLAVYQSDCEVKRIWKEAVEKGLVDGSEED